MTLGEEREVKLVRTYLRKVQASSSAVFDACGSAGEQAEAYGSALKPGCEGGWRQRRRHVQVRRLPSGCAHTAIEQSYSWLFCKPVRLLLQSAWRLAVVPASSRHTEHPR